jgi:hypothetical protein
MQRRYFDPVTGQAGYYGLIEEGSDVVIATLRLRVENRKLTEAEWYLARANDPGLNGPRQSGRGPANNYNTDYLTANPPPERVVPRAQRSTREQLLAIVNSYFRRHHLARRHRRVDTPGLRSCRDGSPTPAGSTLPPLAGRRPER